MLKLKYNFLLVFLLIFSLFMVLNSSSLYYMWVFMELNLMMFLTLLIINSNFISVAPMKYFLISSLSSIVFLNFISLNLIDNKLIYEVILNLSMLMKLGVIPFHFWFVDLMMNLNWMFCFLLSTIQKIIPFLILNNLFNSNLLYFVCLIGGLLGIMLSFNQVFLKKIIAYSSINHMFWMIMSIVLKLNLWFIYFMNYLMINSVLFYIFSKFNLYQLSDLYLLMMNNKLVYKYYLIMMFMSLGGLPPFYGFLLKWYMIINMVDWLIIFLLIFLIIYSLIFLYFYFRVLYNNMMLNFFNLKINYKFNFINGSKYNLTFIFMMNFLCSLNLVMFFFWILY